MGPSRTLVGVPNHRPLSEQRDALPMRWRMAGLEAAFDEVAERFGSSPAATLLPAQLVSDRSRSFVLLVVTDRELVVIPADEGPDSPPPMPWTEIVSLSIDVPGAVLEVRTRYRHLVLRDVAAGMGGPVRLLSALGPEPH